MRCSRATDASGVLPASNVTDADVRVFDTADSLAETMAQEIAELLVEAVRRRGSASIALAGGQTPRSVYRHLAARHGEDVPWQQVHFYWGDERLVAPDDERSNHRMARESLLDALPVRPDRVYPMPSGIAPDRAAAEYEKTLRARFATEGPDFDLVLLGVGEDGHTASLFPHSAVLRESSRWVAAAMAPVDPRHRLTLTLPALTHAETIFMLAVGASKAEAIRRALQGDASDECPASLLRTARARLVWWLDAAAAGSLGIGK
jgi:6-phosphogluconolactonase